MSKKLAVLGTGAIGGSIGADLTRAGYDVALIDQWPAHVEAMKSQGLRVRMPEGELHLPVQAVHICELAGLKTQFDIVFLAAKSYDSRWMAELIKPYLKPDGVLISTQNSLNDEWVAPIIGPERDIGCALELSAELFDPGIVKRNTDPAHTRFVVGELDGTITARVQEVAQILGVAGKTEVTANIWGAKWTKLTVNTMVMGVDSIGGIGPWELVQNTKYVDFCVKLGRETVEVGAALGHTLEPLFGLTAEDFLGSTDEKLKTLVLKLAGDVGKEARSCVLQDLLKGRLSEIGGYLNGLVARKGRDVNVQTPLNEVVASLVGQIEDGKLQMNRSNLEMLDQYL